MLTTTRQSEAAAAVAVVAEEGLALQQAQLPWRPQRPTLTRSFHLQCRRQSASLMSPQGSRWSRAIQWVHAGEELMAQVRLPWHRIPSSG